MLTQTLAQWRAAGAGDLWIFAYASLIWRPEFEFAQALPATVHGWHRALKMRSVINRGTPAVPGLVFALISGGSCKGIAMRVPAKKVPNVLTALWPREMAGGIYDPRWLRCYLTSPETKQNAPREVTALAFTLSRQSKSFTGTLTDCQYRAIFDRATGIYGTTLDYAQDTLSGLRRVGIEDAALARLLALR